MRNIRRFKDIINANVNSALDKAENPEKMIRYMIQEMDESLTDLKASCAAKIAERTRNEEELARLKESLKRWNDRAELAVEKGKDELAREALAEKRKVERALQASGELSVKLDTIISECRENTEKLQEKLESVRLKQRTLIERGIHAQETLSTREKIKEADSNDAFRRFSEIEHRIERMEAEAEMSGFSPAESGSHDEFTAMEHEDDIERELAEMKKSAKAAAQKNKA